MLFFHNNFADSFSKTVERETHDALAPSAASVQERFFEPFFWQNRDSNGVVRKLVRCYGLECLIDNGLYFAKRIDEWSLWTVFCKELLDNYAAVRVVFFLLIVLRLNEIAWSAIIKRRSTVSLSGVAHSLIRPGIHSRIRAVGRMKIHQAPRFTASSRLGGACAGRVFLASASKSTPKSLSAFK